MQRKGDVMINCCQGDSPGRTRCCKRASFGCMVFTARQHSLLCRALY